jgi:hypothetical protein
MDQHSSPFDKPRRIVEEATDTTPAHGIIFETEEEEALWDAALSYRRVLESAPTLDVCLCQWTELKGKKVLGNTHPMCPVHSREGVLVGFIECLKTLPQWVVTFKPSEPDPNGVTLEVQSAAQGSTTAFVDPEPTRQFYPADSVLHSRHGAGQYSAHKIAVGARECKYCTHEAVTGLSVMRGPGSYNMDGYIVPDPEKLHGLGDGPSI